MATEIETLEDRIKAEMTSRGTDELIVDVYKVRWTHSRQVSIVDIQLLLGHQRPTTTDYYLKTLSSSISHLAGIIESSVLPPSTK